METFNVEYKNYKESYNLTLLKNNGKEYNLEALKEVYIKLFKTFEKMEQTDNPITLFRLNKYITELEFEMQELWGFPINEDNHRYWFMCPKYTCPQMDNYVSIGTNYRYYGINCVIHGTNTKRLLNRKDKIERILKKD